MPRRYRKRSSRSVKLVKPVKYSSETYSAFNVYQWAENTLYTSTVIAGTDVLGTRKCKNFSLQIALQPNPSTPADQLIPVLFALVFVPEGNNASPLHSGSTFNDGKLTALSLYEPNQNVILQGVVDGKQIYKFKTRLSRNLNSGDTIQLVWTPIGSFSADSMFIFTLNYALAF